MIPVSEVFGPTIQGEGPVAGRRTVFVRTGGCDFRCSWCDSLHAVLPEHRGEWRKLAPTEVLTEVRALAVPPMMVTLSGGNPAMHSSIGELINRGHAEGYTFAVETQGTIAADWLGRCDFVILSPKPPSSGMKYDREKLAKCVWTSVAPLGRGRHSVALKIVVFNSDDFYFAQHVHGQFPELPLYLSVGNPTPPWDDAIKQHDDDESFTMPWIRGDADRLELLRRYGWLCEKTLQEGLDAIVLPQLHVLTWGNKRGV